MLLLLVDLLTQKPKQPAGTSHMSTWATLDVAYPYRELPNGTDLREASIPRQ